MKTFGRNTVLVILLFASAEWASAQCSAGATSVSYDTTVSGFGNDLYTFTFPKFDPEVGTLTDVNIDAFVTRKYGFEVENTGGTIVASHSVTFISSDIISSSSLGPEDPIDTTFQKKYMGYILAANNGVPNSGPDYRKFPVATVMNNVNYSYTLFNTADFMGTGAVDFNYITSSGNFNQGSVVVDYRNGYVEENVTFRITYNYCPILILAFDVTSFTAGRRGEGIDVKWITKNEKTNRKYEIQKSTDGRVFRSVTELAAQAGTETGSYSYTYLAQPDENNKILYFRLKLKDVDGKSKLTAVRAVRASAAPVEKPMLYPNPAKGATTLLLSNTTRSNWEVEVMTVSGKLVRRYLFNNAQMARLNTNNELNRGLYIIRSVNKTTQEQFVQRLLVQ